MAGERRGPPPFLRHGAYAVVVFVIAITVLLTTSGLDLRGPPLAAFAVGFSVFVAIYYASMWLGWAFLE